MGNFKSIVTKFSQDAEEALARDHEDSYVRISTVIDALVEALREYIQGETAQKIKQLAHKLRGNDSLTADEIALLRLWLVGDAENYINTENSVKDWKNEFRRVVGEISRFTADNPPVQDVFKMQALLRDADRVVDDLAFYAAQKDRVEKFNTAVQTLDREERDILFGLLNTKLESKHY